MRLHDRFRLKKKKEAPKIKTYELTTKVIDGNLYLVDKAGTAQPVLLKDIKTEKAFNELLKEVKADKTISTTKAKTKLAEAYGIELTPEMIYAIKEITKKRKF